MYVETFQDQSSSQSKPGLVKYNPRLGFVRKVYGILSAQLLLTTAFVYIALTRFDNVLNSSWAYALLVISAIITVIISFMLILSTSLARTVPTNYILLLTFTLCESFMVSFACRSYALSDVVLAALLTVSLTTALTIYACTTKTDVSIFGGLLAILTWSMLAIGLLTLLTVKGTVSYDKFNTAISFLGVCFYGCYLIYDTQIIMGGKRYELTLDDYIVGALVIYVDVIALFLKILRFFSKKD
jgi:FtsH-binding integral membrane protein